MLRRLPLLLLALVAVLALHPGLARADATGLSGVVTDGAGVPLEDVEVALFTARGVWLDGTHSDASGAYAFTGLAAGDYKVRFSGGEWATRWHGGASVRAAAAAVHVTAGATRAGVGAALEPAGSIAGTVRGGGTPLLNAQVTVRALDATLEEPVWVYTAKTGAYVVDGLPKGRYSVEFGDPFTWKYAPSAPQTVTVGSGATTTGVDGELAPGASIAGRVSDAATGAGLPLTRVAVVGADGEELTQTSLDASGDYRFTGLLPGTYTVRFASVRDDDGSWAPAASGPIALGATEARTGVDAALTPGASVTGQVRDGEGAGVPYVGVRLVGADGETAGSGMTDADGRYAVADLPAGHFKVEFRPEVAPYGAADRADELTLTAGEARTGVDQVLGPGGSVSGTVTDAAGAGVSELLVVVLDAAGREAARAWTEPGGSYAVTNLAPGTYTLRLSDPDYGYFAERSVGPVTVPAGDPIVADAVVAQPAVDPGPRPTATPTPVATPTPTPTPTPVATPTPVRAPVTRLLATRLAVSARGVVRVPLRCIGASACAGRLTLSVDGRRVSAPYRMAAGRTARIALRLPRAARTALRRRGGRATLVLRPTGAKATSRAVRVR